MPTFTAAYIIDASKIKNIEADNLEQALEKAWENVPHTGLCHACAGRMTTGDVIKVIVSDDDGNEMVG